MTYTTDYKIYTPRLKSKGNRPVSYNRKLGDFTYGYDPSVLHAFGLDSVNFCFFILWDGDKTDGRFNQVVWIKREVSISEDAPINLNAPLFEEKFYQSAPKGDIHRNQAFFKAHGIDCRYMVIKDLHENYALKDETHVAVEVLAADDGILKKTPISLEYMKRLLIENSNGPFKIGKPLNYYETDLEHYLSLHSKETGALFPGDCDLLLFDGQQKCRAVVEFKKCTPYGNIPVQYQSFLNYIKLDRSKYIRLNIMRQYFEWIEGQKIPFINVFYPTTREGCIKLELVKNDLEPGLSMVIPMEDDPYRNQYGIMEKIVKNFHT